MKILLVRLRLIGDVVFTTPVIRALRRHYRDAHITYLVEPAAAAVVAHSPHVNRVWVVPHRRGWRRVADDARLAWQARRAGFDLAVDMHGGPRSAWVTWMTRAPVRVGYDVAGRTWMYTRVAPRSRELRPRHSVVNQWDLLAALDPVFGAGPDPEVDRVEMPVAPEARRAIDARLAAAGVGPDELMIVMHVSAGNPFRRWPERSFAELAAALATDGPDRRVLVTSGPSDREAAARVIADARTRTGTAGARVLDGEGWSLEELRAVMDRAALFVGGDSGPIHIAATSDVPVVGLYGPTLPARSAPWRPRTLPTASVDAGPLPCRPCDQRVCEPGDFRCLTGISVGAVREAAGTILRQNP